MKDVKGHLETLEKNVLVEMIMQQAQENDALREKLLMQAARKTKGGRRLSSLKIIREAIDPGDFIDYYEMGAYASRVQNVLDTLENLLKDSPAEVIELAEYALTETENRHRVGGRFGRRDGGHSPAPAGSASCRLP